MTLPEYVRFCLAAAWGFLALAAGQTALANEATWQALQRGGMVVLMRHTSAEQGPGKGSVLLRDPTCLKARNLSQRGQVEAKYVGQVFQRRSIPVGEVLSSPSCRTQDTARLAFGSTTPVDFLSLSEVLTPSEAARITADALKQIGEYQGSANRVMVTHEPNIAVISFEWGLQGAFLVLKPQGGSTFNVLGTIRLEDLEH